MILATPPLAPKDRAVVRAVDELQGQLAAYVREPRRWTGLVAKVLLARAIRGSNSIEGYDVSLDDAVAAVDVDQPGDVDPTSWAAVTGYRDAMTYVLQLAHDDHFRLTPELIKSLHFMLQQYDLQKWPGRWRPGDVYVVDASGRAVYAGPDAGLVPTLVRELVDQVEAVNDVPAMVRAAMAHLNLALIHPFKDGNGRMARCLQALVLATDGVVSAEFCSIEEYLGRNRQAYYDVLTEVSRGSWNPGGDVRPWIRFCLTAHYRQALTVRRRTREADRIWLFAEHATETAGLSSRTTYGLFSALLVGRLRNASYRAAVEPDITAAAASRDLADLVTAGLLVAHGANRGRSYTPSVDMLAERTTIRDELRARYPTDADPYELASGEIEGQASLFPAG